MIRRDAPGGGLAHPLALGAMALLLLNDHVFKAAWPGLVTGKLSDFAGMVFFPLLLQACWELLTGRVSGQRLLWACALATGLVFGATQLWEPAGSAYRWGLGVLQWPLRCLAAGGWVALRPVALWPDPTDLVALPALGVALWLGHQRSETLRPPS